MMTDSVMTQAQLTLISHKLDLCSSNARVFIIRLYTAAEIFLIFFHSDGYPFYIDNV